MDQIRQIAKAKFDSLGGKSIDQDITGDNNGASNNSNNSGGSNAGTGTNNRGVSNNNQKSADNAASLVQGLQRQGKSDNKSDTNNSNSLVGLILKVLSANGGLIGTLSAALPWVMSPVVADVLVFVLAIAFIKFRPQGLIAGKGV